MGERRYAAAVTIVPFDFETDGGVGSRACLGVIVLETDQTIEAEMRQVQLPGVATYHARVANDMVVTPESLTAMAQRLPVAASLLPRDFSFDAIGYACTSASTLIGDERVEAAIRQTHPEVACTNPILATVAAFRALDVTRIGVVTPYTEEVTGRIVDHFDTKGLEVSVVGSFLEENDFVVARIAESSIAAAVRDVGSRTGAQECDAVFVSCTSLRSFGIVEGLETELGKPVVSSNLAFLWHLLRLGGVDDKVSHLGRLFLHH